jgi:hypothetical protein
LLLDGQELGEVLDRATDLGGRVVRVARVRRAGLAGLFGARRYEVTVDVDGLAPRPGAPRPPVATPGTPATRPGLAALLEAADGGDECPARAAPGGPTRGQAVVTSPPTPSHPVAAAPAPGASAPVPPALVAPALAAPALAAPALAAPALAAPAPGPSAAPPSMSVPAGAAARSPGGAVPVVWPRVARPGGADPRESQDVAVRLRRLGVPADLLVPASGAGPVGDDDAAALLGLAARLGRPPVLAQRPGAVVAIVGPGGPVLETCAQVLASVGVAPVRLLLAGEVGGAPGARLADARAAARLRAEAQDAVVIVAVATQPPVQGAAGLPPAPLTPPTAVAAVLDALRPDQAWAALDAAGPAAGLAAVAGLTRVDAVAVPRPEECPRPGELLALGAPVGWLGGRPATPVAWAALLEDALARMAGEGRRLPRSG